MIVVEVAATVQVGGRGYQMQMVVVMVVWKSKCSSDSVCSADIQIWLCKKHKHCFRCFGRIPMMK